MNTDNKVCPKCGQEIKEGTKFCRFCGSKLIFKEKFEDNTNTAKKSAATLVLSVFVGIPIFIFFLSNITADDTYTSPPPPPRATIQVLNAKIINHGYGFKEVQGIVKNNSDVTCASPRVVIHTFDSAGNRVGENFVPIFDSLAPGETYKFGVPALDAKSFEVKSCYCEEY